MSELATKIAKAGQDVGGKLSADKTNQEQRYDYISADKINSVCGQALFNQGIVVLPEVTTQDVTLFEYTDNYGKSKRRYDASIGMKFIISDGSESIEMLWVGMGSDYTVPDKATYKAVTSGHKYFLMKLLCVGAGNEDGEHEPEPAATNTKAKVQKQAEQPQPEPAPVIEYPAHLLDTVSKDGQRYVDLPDDKLRIMAASIRKAMPQADEEKKAQYSLKLDAIKEIQAIRTGK